MGAIASALSQNLKRPNIVRHQILAYICLARIHYSIKLSYDLYLGQSSATTKHKIDADHDDDDDDKKDGERKLDVDSLTTTLERRCSSSAEQVSTTQQVNLAKPIDTGSESFNWDWQSFRSMSRFLQVYELASTSYILWAFMRTVFFEQIVGLLDPLSRWLFNMPGNCLIAGQVAAPIAVSHSFSLVLTSAHLIWRLTQWRARPNRLLTMVVFLLASERDLEHFYGNLEANEFTRTTTRPDEMDKTERLFKQVMCYQVPVDDRIYFKLRPNRTRAFRRQLIDRMTLVLMVAVAYFALGVVTVQIYDLVIFVSDYCYAHMYPGCDLQLDERRARGELTGIFPLSMTPNLHHLLVGLLYNVLDSLIVLFDTGLSLNFVPAFCYLLNYDLLVYWSHVNTKLSLLLRRSAEFSLRYPADGSATFRQDFTLAAPSAGKLPMGRNGTLLAANQVTNTGDDELSRNQASKSLESDIHELQSEMLDFFQQISRVDLLVGDTLTTAILVWLFLCAHVNYTLILQNKTFLPWIVQLVLIMGFLIIVMFTYHSLELRRCCLKSYHSLCSLVAHDQTRKRRDLMKLLEFYESDGTGTAYRLCRSLTYKPTIIITIIGWSFSCFFIIYSLFGPRRAQIFTWKQIW